MSRITKTPEERKHEIVLAALELFSEKGYENTTIQDIADHMNVATGLCYRYFKSKQDIFAATSEYYARQATAALAFPEDSNALTKFNLIIFSLLQYAIKHNEFESSYHNEPDISASRLDQLANQIVIKMIPIIEQGVSEGIFACNDIPNTLNFLAFGIIHMIHIEMPKQNSQDHILSFVPLIKELCANVLNVKELSKLGAEWENL